MRVLRTEEWSSRQIWRGVFLLGAVWTGLVLAAGNWMIRHEHREANHLVYQAAEMSFQKDHAFRKWAMKYNGVYVPITPTMPPDPYLADVPERDVQTLFGKKLTLMCPAHMLRTVMDDFDRQCGIKGRLTSLHPLRARNAPDLWERSAIEAFRHGEDEAVEMTSINGEPYFRLMRPLATRENCLKCHSHQNFKVGEINGGVGVLVPAKPYLRTARKNILLNSLGLGMIWVLGLGIIGICAWQIQKYNSYRQHILNRQSLLQEQLQEAQKMRAVGHLAGGVAHEFNNLLQGILGFNEIAQREVSPEQAVWGHLQQVDKAGRRAATLVQELLAFSSQEPLCLQPMKLNDVVADRVDILRDLLGRDINLEVSLASDLHIIYGDSAQIGEILTNLCLNARDATPYEGTVRIETRRVRIEKERKMKNGFVGGSPNSGEYVCLSVSDTGRGMDEETLHCAFEPFFTTKDVGEGTGLGLSMVYGMVEQHHGKLRVQSAPGKGTTITIYFPISHDAKP